MSSKILSLTGRQIRAARALLGWSGQDLADRARVGITTIRRAELSDGPIRMIPGTVEAVLRAFDAAGVAMTSEDDGGVGVRLAGRPAEARRALGGPQSPSTPASVPSTPVLGSLLAATIARRMADRG